MLLIYIIVLTGCNHFWIFVECNFREEKDMPIGLKVYYQTRHRVFIRQFRLTNSGNEEILVKDDTFSVNFLKCANH